MPTFSIEIVFGTGWTEQLPNGTLTGMGGQLLRDEADVVLSFSEFRPYRAEKLAFSIVIHVARLVPSAVHTQLPKISYL